MPLLNQIASAEIENADTVVPDQLVLPLQYLLRLGVIEVTGEFNNARYNFLLATLPATERQSMIDALTLAMDQAGATVGNFFDDAFKGVQHFAAGMGMQVPRASFLILVRMNAFGYANKLSRALQYTDTREKLENLWWRVGGQPDVLRSAITEGATKPAATDVQDQKGALIKLATAGGTYTDAQGVKHDINTGAVVAGADCGCNDYDGGAVGIVPVVAAAIISSAAIIVSAIMPVISKMLDNKGAAVPGLPVDPTTGLPLGYNAPNSIIGFIQSNPLIVAIGALGLYFAYENYQ